MQEKNKLSTSILYLQEGRTEVNEKLESSIAENNVDKMGGLPLDFELIHRVYGFKKEEK